MFKYNQRNRLLIDAEALILIIFDIPLNAKPFSAAPKHGPKRFAETKIKMV
jgi:hypothetical protein